MKRLIMAVVLALAMTMAFTSVASAHTLRYPTAKNLAVKLAEKQEAKGDVERWRIFGAERTGVHEIVWVYNVDYTDGSLCDAELVVRYTTKSNGKPVVRAFFRDVTCER